MRAQLFINESSRLGRASAAAVRAQLSAHRIEYIEAPPSAGIADGIDALIAAGGDGTVAGLIAGAMKRSLPIGVIPLGTFNELARTLNIPLEIPAACALIASKSTRAIDVGRVNEQYFLNEASLGISSRLTRLQTPENKQRFGLLAIVASASQFLKHARPIHIVAIHDGVAERFKTVQLTIANSHRFGGWLAVSDASIDDGWLDLYSVEIKNFWQAALVGRAILAGKRQAVPGLRTARATRFELRTRHDHHIVADGEPAGCTPATIDVLPKALRVFAPQ